jgi:uncharacterized protein
MRAVNLIIPVSVLSFGCQAGKPAETIRPDAPTASDAMEEGKFECTSIPSHPEPLVVDWKASDRMNLALALQQPKVAVVAYDCSGLRLLRDCSLPGGYAFAGAGMMEEMVQLVGSDEVSASLPLNGVSLGAGMQRNSSIDIAIAYIGKRGSLVDAAARTDLVGTCDGATHYVRGALVGAFAVQSGTAGDLHATAEVWKVSASAASNSERKELNRDGDIEACKQYEPGTDKPPGQCQSAIRLELAPIVGDAGASAVASPPAAAGGSAEPLPNPCPEGYALAQGKCTRATAEATAAFRCAPTDLSECEAQCEKGNADSCYNAGQLHHRAGIHRPGTPVPPGQDYETKVKDAAKFYERGCELGAMPACNQTAGLYLNGTGGKSKDVAKGRELLERACNRLDWQACVNLSSFWKFTGDPKPNIDQAIRWSQRACDLGSAAGCGSLASIYLEDKKRSNTPQALAILEQACIAGHPSLCWQLSDLYAKGKKVKKDAAKSAAYLADACKKGLRSDSCK